MQSWKHDADNDIVLMNKWILIIMMPLLSIASICIFQLSFTQYHHRQTFATSGALGAEWQKKLVAVAARQLNWIARNINYNYYQ